MDNKQLDALARDVLLLKWSNVEKTEVDIIAGVESCKWLCVDGPASMVKPDPLRTPAGRAELLEAARGTGKIDINIWGPKIFDGKGHLITAGPNGVSCDRMEQDGDVWYEIDIDQTATPLDWAVEVAKALREVSK